MTTKCPISKDPEAYYKTTRGQHCSNKFISQWHNFSTSADSGLRSRVVT